MDEAKLMEDWEPGVSDNNILEDWPSFNSFENSLPFNELQQYSSSSYQIGDQNTNALEIDQEQNSFENILSSPNHPAMVTPDLIDPLDRYFQERKDDPWYPKTQVGLPALADDLSPTGQYRECDVASAASSVTGPYGDSGYKTFSAHSADEGLDEPSTFGQEIPILQQGIKMLQPGRRTSRASSSSLLSAPTSSAFTSAKRRPKRSHEESTVDDVKACGWADCKFECRLQSELTKHMLRHERPYKCLLCSMGFPTTNDLVRHSKTVHNQIPPGTKAWSCVVQNCRSNRKVWYRQDNFAAHVKQHTKDEYEIEDIVKRSEYAVGAPTSHPLDSPTLPADTSMSDGGPCSQQSYSPDATKSASFSPMSTNGMAGAMNDRWVVPRMAFSPSFQDTNNRNFSNSGFSRLSADNLDPTSCASSVSRSDGLQSLFPLPELNVNNATQTPLAETHRPSKQVRSVSSARSRERESGRRARRDRSQRAPITVKRPVILHQPAESNIDPNSETADLQTGLQTILQKNLSDEQTTIALKYLLAAHPTPSNIQSTKVDKIPRRVSSVSDSSCRGRRTRESDKLQQKRTASSNPHCLKRLSQPQEIVSVSRMADSASSSKGISFDGKFHCHMPDCGKHFPRRSALEKHITRHERPYGCTFDSCPCSKRFGSKNDWKRHENSRHFQPELFRCEKCFKTFECENEISIHAREIHNITAETDLVEFCKQRKIGVNHAETFWCGFCNLIIALKAGQKGVEAWDERYNHIAAHFVPDRDRMVPQRKIEDWLPPDGIWTKGEKEKTQKNTDQEASYLCQPSNPTQNTNSHNFGFSDHSDNSAERTQSNADTESPATVGPDTYQSCEIRTRKRAAKLNAKMIICCRCGNSSSGGGHSVCCYYDHCDHVFCDRCTRY